MANAKSNIYPIQLQGAELCLNRYDAEIKQYSGFNKNNSPFVGGCLSNVFEKNETLEGATDENTYIDENGDIYRVDTTGLYKNEEKLVDYTGCDFIEREKIEVPYNDVVKMYSDKVYLRINEKQEIYLNDVFVGVNKFENMSLDSFLASYSCGVWYHGKFIFACWAFESMAGARVVNRFITLEKNSDGEYVVGTVNYTQNKSTAPGDIDYDFSPVSIIVTNDYFDVMYVRRDAETKEFSAFYNYAGNFNSDTVTETFLEYNQTIITKAPGWSGYDLIPTYMDSGKKLSFEIYSYPRNELNYRYITQLPLGSSARVPLTIKLDAEECQSQIVLNSDNVTRSINLGSNMAQPSAVDTYAKTKLLPSSIVNYNVNVFRNIINSVFYYQFYGFAGAAIYKTGDNDYEVAGGATRTMENCNYAVLINNGVVSGIAAYKDNHKILVTNWNTVNECLITYIQREDSDEVDLLYGDFEGNYYLLKKSETPKLKKVYNQIVTNALYNYNCYFLDKNKLGCYATGFNYSQSLFSSLNIYNASVFDTVKYTAAAINEYKLKDNASILLNPFPCHLLYSPEDITFLSVDVFQTDEANIVPVYTNSYYWNGIRTLKTIDDDLVGLPYPTDTNGNVSYNPSLFSEIINIFGNKLMIKENSVLYFLQTYDNEPVMSFYMASGVENIENAFIIQGQYYGIIDDNIFTMQYNNGVVVDIVFIVSVKNLQYVGNTPYEALFFSKTNRCLYSFTGANVLNQKQFIDKISEVRNYLYNPATQTVFLITDIGVLFYGLFGMFLLDYTNITNIFLLDNGIVMSDNNGNYRYIKYYLDEGDTDYEKQNIRLETSFYGMNNEMVTINDCLYFRIFSEEHEEGDLKVSATTISLSGRKTEETTFKIKASDWDKITHTIYLRYQPKTQRGLGVAFAIDSPFKIASMSVGSQPDAVLVDKVSKGAITAPSVTTNNNEW